MHQKKYPPLDADGGRPLAAVVAADPASLLDVVGIADVINDDVALPEPAVPEVIESAADAVDAAVSEADDFDAVEERSDTLVPVGFALPLDGGGTELPTVDGALD